MKPADREATGRELAELLERIDEAEEAIRKATKEAKERVGGLRDRARELAAVLTGKKGAQLPLAAAVLEEAREVKARKHVTVYRSGKKKPPKFPKGTLTRLDDPCTECGEPFGDHAGQKCPPKKTASPLDEVSRCVDANGKRYAEAMKAGAKFYECADPEEPDEPSLMRCVECDRPKDAGVEHCPCENEKGAADGT